MMKKFAIRLLLFCLLPLPLLFAVGYVVDKGLQQSRYFYYAEWNDLLAGKINGDMLIFGTSRAWVQFSPQILDSTLNLNSYNLGMDGAPFDMQYERFKVYLKYNKKPKYIVQEVGYNTTFIKSGGLPHFEQFFPYYGNKDIWPIVNHYSATPMSLPEHYFPMYKYNNQLPLVKEGIFSYFGHGIKALKYKGYQGQTFAWDSTFHTFKTMYPNGHVFDIDTAAVRIFKDYLQYCRANDIQVIMVMPPFYKEVLPYIKNFDEVMQLINGLSKDYQAPFLNYMNDPLCSDRSYFYNTQHLNKAGAELFSRHLAGDLKNLLH